MPYCKNCGTQNADSAAFCTNCGKPMEKPVPPAISPTPSSPSASNKSVIAMILGIMSIIVSCGPVTGIAAIILANQELRAIREGQSPEAGKTLCQVALWTGWIGTVACGLFWIIYFVIILFAVGVNLGKFH